MVSCKSDVRESFLGMIFAYDCQKLLEIFEHCYPWVPKTSISKISLEILMPGLKFEAAEFDTWSESKYNCIKKIIYITF